MTHDDQAVDVPPAPSFAYAGRIYVRLLGRGVVLEDHPQQLYLEDVLEEGYYRAVITLYAEPEPARPST